MPRLLRFALPDGGDVIVEVADDDSGMARAGRLDDATTLAAVTFDEAIAVVRRAADATLQQFRKMTSRPDEVEIEFGVRLTAETGAIIARTEAEAQLTVRLTWTAAA